MGRTLFITGFILIAFGGAFFIVGFFNLLPFQQSTPIIGPINATINSSETTIPVFQGFQAFNYDIYSETKVNFHIIPSSETTFNVKLRITFDIPAPNQIELETQTITVPASSQGDVSFSLYVIDLIPQLFGLLPPYPSVGKPAQFFDADLIVSTTGGSASTTYQAEGNVYWKFLLPFSYVIFVIGILVFLIGLITRSRGPKAPKPLRYQAKSFEPTLSGDTDQQSRFSRKSKPKQTKQKAAKKVAPTRSTQTTGSTNRCKQCSKPVPRKAQYCPHCYARQ